MVMLYKIFHCWSAFIIHLVQITIALIMHYLQFDVSWINELFLRTSAESCSKCVPLHTTHISSAILFGSFYLRISNQHNVWYWIVVCILCCIFDMLLRKPNKSALHIIHILLAISIFFYPIFVKCNTSPQANQQEVLRLWFESSSVPTHQSKSLSPKEINSHYSGFFNNWSSSTKHQTIES